MKKLLLTSVLAVAGAFTASAALITTTGTQPSVGNGNKNNPYEIRTAAELRWFVHYENTRHWYPNDYAKLMADIDLSSICGPEKGSWIPLGFSEESGAKDHWYGSLEGNGYTVSGLYIDCNDFSGKPAGFCGKVSSGKLYNLTVQGEIHNTANYTGGLIGWNYDDCAIVENCASNVDFYLNKNDAQVGGLIGRCDASGTAGAYNITNCTYEGKFVGSQCEYYGTLVGYMKSTSCIKACSGYCGHKDVGGSSYAVPLIGYAGSSFDIRYCLSDAHIIDYLYSSSVYLSYIYYGYIPKDGNATSIDEIYYLANGVTYNYDASNSTLPISSFNNGEACYKTNQRMGGQYFKQTIGTQKVPYSNGSGSTVYLAKQYTKCGSDEFWWVYSNSSADITDQRNHVFDAEHANCTVCGGGVSPYYQVNKDAEDYYLLSTPEDIKWFWTLVNVSGITDAKMRLTADINMADEPMAPLAEFSGVIDGQYHRLDNINISGTGIDKLGLVGHLNGTVRNLVLSGSVQGTYVSFLGAAAGYVSGSGSVTGVRNECTVKATGTINGTMRMDIGGIAGYVAGSVTNCINCGPVVDATTCTGSLRRYIAGVVGTATDISNLSHLVNNAVVGAYSNANILDGSGNAVANLFSQENINSYYVTGIANPGIDYFFSNTANHYDTAVSPLEVGSGRLAWLLAGKNYDTEDAATGFFGQTIGTDMVPYPFVSTDHKGVYNTRHYYTCDSYSDYSNSPTDEIPAAHKWNDGHYCNVCCAIDPEYVPQSDTKAYLISTPEQYNIFATAVNAAEAAKKPMKYASASIRSDLDFTSTSLTNIHELYGRIHGNGHKMTLGTASTVANIATTINQDGIIEYLDMAFPSGGYYPMVLTNNGQIVGCNITQGIPAARSAGLVIDCSGELPSSKTLYGRHTRCLVKMITVSGIEDYHLYNSNVAYNQAATCTEHTVEEAASGELAYALSHDSDASVWGQDLGTDASPRIYFGQTPTSDAYVTRLTSYSVGYPEGKIEYMNAGMALEAAPGYYKVCEDTESWTSRPDHNFIVDLGDGTYSASDIRLDPTVQHWLPFEVVAERFSYEESFEKDDVVSLMFPVEMPITKINGEVYLFYGYNSTEKQLEFFAPNDLNVISEIPANTPILVKANGGSIIYDDGYSESYPLSVLPMTESGSIYCGDAVHLAGYKSESLPTETTEGLKYFKLSGTAAHTSASKAGPSRAAGAALSAVAATDGDCTAEAFGSYFAIPADGLDEVDTLPVVLRQTTQTGLQDAVAPSRGIEYPCDVRNLSGVLLMKAASPADLHRLTPGYYILSTGNNSHKITLR